MAKENIKEEFIIIRVTKKEKGDFVARAKKLGVKLTVLIRRMLELK